MRLIPEQGEPVHLTHQLWVLVPSHGQGRGLGRPKLLSDLQEHPCSDASRSVAALVTSAVPQPHQHCQDRLGLQGCDCCQQGKI